MQDGPETCLWQCGREGQGRSAEEHRDLGGKDGYDHLPDKPKGGDPGEQPCKQEEPSYDLGSGDDMGRQFGQRETQFCKSASSLVGIDKFQDTFPEEDSAGHEADP